MNINGSMTVQSGNGAASLYDRITHLYDLTFKFNGYARSMKRYLRRIAPLTLPDDARILDAGCGTGLLTLSLLRVIDRPARITAVDLSSQSLVKAQQAVRETATAWPHVLDFTRANVLSLPFADESFDLVMTSGALEYVPLSDGFRELARVLRPGGHMLHLPVKPSPASRLLELLFRFKTHSPREVDQHTRRHFHIIERYRFPPLHPIGWTKIAVLARKK